MVSDKIEHEIEDFYDEYSSKRLKEQILKNLLQKYRTNIESDAISKNITLRLGAASHESLESPVGINYSSRKKSITQPGDIVHTDVLSDSNSVDKVKLDQTKGPRWPKFEDILLEIGKRYDWKNDRWLKVKVKLKDAELDSTSENNIDFHEKHKFHYKMVKLNRSKNRRNVVVAVSAVR